MVSEGREKPKLVVNIEVFKNGDLWIAERMGSNPGYGLCGDWASTRDNGFQMDGFSDEVFINWSPLAHKFP